MLGYDDWYIVDFDVDDVDVDVSFIPFPIIAQSANNQILTITNLSLQPVGLDSSSGDNDDACWIRGVNPSSSSSSSPISSPPPATAAASSQQLDTSLLPHNDSLMTEIVASDAFAR